MSSFAEQSCDVIEAEALRARDGLPLVAVARRAEEEQLPAGTGVEALARRLRQRREAVLLEYYLREAFFECCPHDSLLAGRYCR